MEDHHGGNHLMICLEKINVSVLIHHGIQVEVKRIMSRKPFEATKVKTHESSMLRVY